MFVVKFRKIFLGLSAFLALASLVLIGVLGLNWGIEFTGGTMLEVAYQEGQVPEQEKIEQQAKGVYPERSFTIQQAGEYSYIIRTSELEEEEFGTLVQALSFDGYEAEEKRSSSIGPSMGEELRNKALVAIVVVIAAIILYIAYVFRQVSYPVSSWKYGVTAIVALVHDILIPVGLFAVLGYWLGAEIDVLFVTALLAILGFSVNDTIVVFDRLRENLRNNEENETEEPFEETVGRSLKQTYTRSINTSLTTLFVLGALYLIGGSVTQYFALVLITGVVAGTYSSIFLASPIIVELEEKQRLKTAAGK